MKGGVGSRYRQEVARPPHPASLHSPFEPLRPSRGAVEDEPSEDEEDDDAGIEDQARGGGREWWKRVVGESGGREWWERVVEESGGREWWKRVVEAEAERRLLSWPLVWADIRADATAAAQIPSPPTPCSCASLYKVL